MAMCVIATRRAGTMPVLLLWLEPDDIAWPDFFDGVAPPLYPANP
jgi:hypothetical protein